MIVRGTEIKVQWNLKRDDFLSLTSLWNTYRYGVKSLHTMAELLDVSSVGEVKVAQYGEIFLKTIAAYKEASGHES